MIVLAIWMEKRSPYAYITSHSLVNNEGNLHTMTYESFEIFDQDEMSNIERNISIVMGECDVFQNIVLRTRVQGLLQITFPLKV